jgi:8-oxo-dGTP pyrophosphatase MutT (NUDIX family)
LPNEEHVDVVVRELHEETGLILNPDDLTMLSDAPVRVALLEELKGNVSLFTSFRPLFRFPTRQLIYVYLLSLSKLLLPN